MCIGVLRSYSRNLMSKTIKVLVEVVIFTSIIGTIAVQVLSVENVSGAALVLLGLTTLFVVIGFIVLLLKQMGLYSGR